MKTKVSRCHVYPIGNVRQYGWILAVLFGFLIHSNAHAFNLTVVGSDGQLVAGFRWLMEEDATQFSVTGVSAEPEVNYSLSFHTSYMPVVTKSSQAINDIAVDATKRFKLIVEGFNNKERVDSLCISLKTVETHQANLMKKLIFHNVAELLSVAEVVGIVDHSAERRLQTNFVRFRPLGRMNLN